MTLPPIPDSRAAGLAGELAEHFSSPALVNHCRRSYLFAAAYGLEHGIDFDAELLCVSSMLHDLGLSPAFDNHAEPFEKAGGNVAWAFAAGAGWSRDRREHASRIVVDHMRDVTAAENAEGHLLMLATSLDISGQRPADWTDDLKSAVLEQYPRLELGREFLACFQDQAVRKPGTTAAASVASGIAERIAANPLDRR